jgi:hypothetical protein
MKQFLKIYDYVLIAISMAFIFGIAVIAAVSFKDGWSPLYLVIILVNLYLIVKFFYQLGVQKGASAKPD